MKCPKCDYLGFESTDRCRNCGYEFALSSASTQDPAPALELRPALDLDRIIGAPDPDLPLFGEPRITPPARPRAPLGVRRATPEVPRAKVRAPRPAEEMLFGGLSSDRRGESRDARASIIAGIVGRGAAPRVGGETAAPSRRMMAALLDAALLLGLDAAVLYFTLRLLNLKMSEIFELPAFPLLAFFVLLNGGYLVAFTAVGGQSIGKMALGIKVVSDENLPVPVGRATLRTLAYLASALPLGAGFLPGVLGADRLAFHDRLTHTRVVRPSA